MCSCHFYPSLHLCVWKVNFHVLTQLQGRIEAIAQKAGTRQVKLTDRLSDCVFTTAKTLQGFQGKQPSHTKTNYCYYK